ncbi:MAG: hypothetical protein NT154_16190 [Verrucomicrobia bacterium]|nr:hypothetical protein [Verrucomicrobiota bacterium]
MGSIDATMTPGGSNLTLSVLALTTSVASMLLLMYATVVWCVDIQPPLRILGMGFGLVVLTLAIAWLLADKTALRRMLKPLLLAFVVEYVLAFGTLGLGYISERLQRAALWFHYPGEFLKGLYFSSGSRSTIRRDITCIAIGEWLFIALLLYLVQWYILSRHARQDLAQQNGLSQ